MAQTQHALHLPEITFQVVQYLETSDVIACSLVCKDFRASFEPFVWMNICLGTFSVFEAIQARCEQPLAKYISISIRGCRADMAGHARQDRILQGLQRIAPWIRSLTIRAHVFPRQLKFANRCAGVNTLFLAGIPHNDQFDESYWNDVEALLRQNSACLQSLTLVGWRERYSDGKLGQPLWRPLLTCAQHSNLSTLKLHSVMVSERDMEALWEIGQQLEILELTNLKKEDMSIQNSGTSAPETTSESNQNLSQAGDHVIHEEEASATTATTATSTPAVRFPKLRKLKLERLDMEPWDELGYFIDQCPLLQTLIWSSQCDKPFLGIFCDRLAAGTWPCLDWIEIVCSKRNVTEHEHAALLKSSPRSLRCLDVNVQRLEGKTFNLYRELGHFKTLTKVVLELPNIPESSLGSVISKQVQEVLESCPLLEHIVAVNIIAQDIIQGKPWVCHRLKVFQVMIGLELSDSNHVQAGGRAGIKYTKDQRTQFRHIFERLGQLKQLTVLDMRLINQDLNLHHRYSNFTSLPLRLSMGLGHLSTLKNLEVIGYYGPQEIQVVDMEWILQHWKNLRHIQGTTGYITVNWTGTPDGVVDERSRLIQESLRERGLQLTINPDFGLTARQSAEGVEFDSESE
ncbi:hypothetical protein B0O80DRAFT_499697 [Mortierella sp. GBAus27b]|nr:hypothetical protein B0O80DRAFT_499697 [Mortierella sp. GBAus27b]